MAVALSVALGAGLAAPGPAAAAPYAAIVMDMRTGKVVHARGADRRQHPASLTKLMTLYLAFEALETGQLRLDQKVRISRKAARQPPSKLGMRPGQRVSVRSLIRATAIKSANDAAMALAEAIGGSQRGFARLMTNKARDLGMAQTTFRNPHGLTQSGHLSTARDMAQLARALYFDFPQYYNIFGRRSATAAGKRVYTTNRLLASYSGAEGMKTGYTRAAGYNLVAAAKRGNRRVVAVLMGGKSSRWRNQRIARLLDMGFKRVPARVAEIPPQRAGKGDGAVAKAPLPQPRPGAAATGIAALGSALASPAAAAARDLSRHAPLYAELPRPAPGRRAARPEPKTVRLASAGSLVVPAGGVPVPAARPRGAAGDWQIQLGAYRDRQSAERRVRTIASAGIPVLSEGSPAIAQRRRAGRAMYLVRVQGLGADEARSACSQLEASGKDCMAIAPSR
ncbi:D-alanyl-D-alanine carboxypeptidase family protein [Paralimibaculum aggregatum]|uniref:D-alanyl-D-alanine carboxypeptidase family protein n=2 Tax=Paralimibaculum aggregatum TaxID=3036245 RepID=A0ABQ6LFV5_9RHOB|nr:D-alanyl-D-alanine carboxypeptidase family protein [Limibaculum sp. NKW23]